MSEEYARKETVERAFTRIEILEKNTTQIKEKLITLETIVETIKDIPKTMQEISEAMVSVKCEMKHFNEKLDDIKLSNKSQDTEITRQKQRGTIDFLNGATSFFQTNWLAIGTILYLLFTQNGVKL